MTVWLKGCVSVYLERQFCVNDVHGCYWAILTISFFRKKASLYWNIERCLYHSEKQNVHHTQSQTPPTQVPIFGLNHRLKVTVLLKRPHPYSKHLPMNNMFFICLGDMLLWLNQMADEYTEHYSVIEIQRIFTVSSESFDIGIWHWPYPPKAAPVLNWWWHVVQWLKLF